MEKWKTITDFPDYQISNYGRVKSLSRDYKFGKHGDIILKMNDRRGYCGVTLFKDGRRHYKAVHRLVADAFIENPYKLPVVNHQDENRKNNRADNLEWCTSMYNSNYGLCRAKISARVSRAVCQFTIDGRYLNTYKSMTDASIKTGVYLSEISNACNFKQKTAGGYIWRRKNGK